MGRLAGKALGIETRRLGGRLEALRSSSAPADIAATSAEPVGASYVSTLVTLTASQAAGTDAVLAENADRKGLGLSVVAAMPSGAEWGLAAFSGAGQGVPFGPEPTVRWTGARVPTNAVYVRGFTAGDKLLVWEA